MSEQNPSKQPTGSDAGEEQSVAAAPPAETGTEHHGPTHREQDRPTVLHQILSGSVLMSFLAVVLAMLIGGLLIAFADQDVREAAGYFFARPTDTISAAWTSMTDAYIAMFRGSVFDWRASTFAGMVKPLTESMVFSIPLILAGLPEWVAVYRELNTYPHLVDVAIERNPDDMKADELRGAAWDHVAARLAQDRSRLLDRLNEQRARGTGVVDPHETLTAAREGRVDTLLLTADGCYGQAHDGRVVLLPTDDDGDVCALADAAARATLRNGGAIRVVEELPEEATVGAVLRY